MESRKIQRSGTTNYLYLPAAWCREHKITTDSIVYLEKSSKGDLVVQPKKTESSLSSLKLDLSDNSPEVINKMIIASYINPVKEFRINLKENLTSDQILKHKQLLGGMEIVDFDESSITCQTSLALNDADLLLAGMIKKILSITKLMKKDANHELIVRYEEEIDKSNLLIHKSIITTLMYRRESKLRHIDLFYIGMISRSLEQLTDTLITLSQDTKLVDTIDIMMKSLLKLIETPTQSGVIAFIKNIEKLDNIEVNNLETYKKKRVYSLMGYISEILCDRQITELVDKSN
jgi:phosphate uptake regulator